MKKFVVLLLVLLIIIVLTFIVKLFFLNEEKILKYSELNKQKIILAGEWYSVNDSTKGLSIRDNKIAFFKAFVFNSDDIYEYKIIDSIHKQGNSKSVVGEYIMMSRIYKDTIYNKIIFKNDSILTLEINLKNQTFKRKGLIKHFRKIEK